MRNMIGKIFAAEVGRRLAGRDNGIKGALIGAAAPWLLRRAFTPAGIAIIAAIAAKKLYDNKRAREQADQKRLSGIRRSPQIAAAAPARPTPITS